VRVQLSPKEDSVVPVWPSKAAQRVNRFFYLRERGNILLGQRGKWRRGGQANSKKQFQENLPSTFYCQRPLSDFEYLTKLLNVDENNGN